MKRLILAVAILALSAGVTYAGTNPNVLLFAHGDLNGEFTTDDPCGFCPATCEELQTHATDPGYGGVWTGYYYLAVVVSPPENSPNIATVIFGLGTWDTAQGYVYNSWGACTAFPISELSTAGWPGPDEGTSVTWAPNCHYEYILPVYYFQVYAAGTPPVIPLGPHPTQGGNVVDCGSPPTQDPFLDYGEFEGTNPDCPGAQQEWGACCVDMNGDGNDETCYDVANEQECWDVYNGSEFHLMVPCVYPGQPSPPCPEDIPPTATQESTWGSIKSVYR
jgi:hypothetical protein